MKPEIINIDNARYAKCIEVSKRIRWDIDRDVIRGRAFDLAHDFLPIGLSRLDRADYLPAVIHSTDRQRYYEALRGPERQFRRFLLDAIGNSLDNSARLFERELRAGA